MREQVEKLNDIALGRRPHYLPLEPVPIPGVPRRKGPLDGAEDVAAVPRGRGPLSGAGGAAVMPDTAEEDGEAR